MSRKPFIAAASICFAFIVYATLCPLHDRPHFWGPHEPYWIAALERLTAFMILGFAAHFVLSLWRSFLLMLAVAIGLELLQSIVPHRDPSVIDAAVKIVGGVIGIISHWSLRWQQARFVSAAVVVPT
jgi:VanZ like family